MSGGIEVIENIGSLAEEALSIQLIAERVFVELPVKDLKNCALVSKIWNFHARNVYKFTATIKEGQSCRQLKELNDLLENSDNIPFDGLSISGPCISDKPSTCIKSTDVDTLIGIIKNRLEARSLTIWISRESTPCPTVECMQQLCRHFARELQSLHLLMIPSAVEIREFFRVEPSIVTWLSNLRFLEIPSFDVEELLSISNFKILMEATPNLQQLTGNIVPKYLDCILDSGKTFTISEFEFDPNATMFLKTSLVFAQSLPRLKKLRIRSISDIVETQLPWMFTEITKFLLFGSGESLVELKIDHFNLYLYTQMDLPDLKKLQRLSITYEDIGEGIVNLRRVDFARFFPSLTAVEIRYADLSNIDIQLPGDFQRLVCPTVTCFKLTVGNRELNLNPIDNFSKIFPNVQHFYCHGCLDLRDICIFLWTAWGDLESITFTDLASHHIPNLDWMFCGIFEAEAIHLLKVPWDFQKYHLVSCFPSIMNCKKLKKFRVEIKHFGRDCEINRFFPSFLSHITGYLALSRTPGLVTEVNYRSYCRQAPCGYSLEHLKPFANFGEFVHPELSVYSF